MVNHGDSPWKLLCGFPRNVQTTPRQWLIGNMWFSNFGIAPINHWYLRAPSIHQEYPKLAMCQLPFPVLLWLRRILPVCSWLFCCHQPMQKILEPLGPNQEGVIFFGLYQWNYGDTMVLVSQSSQHPNHPSTQEMLWHGGFHHLPSGKLT